MFVITVWFASIRGKRTVSLLLEDGRVVSGIPEAELFSAGVEDVDDLVGSEISVGGVGWIEVGGRRICLL